MARVKFQKYLLDSRKNFAAELSKSLQMFLDTISTPWYICDLGKLKREESYCTLHGAPFLDGEAGIPNHMYPTALVI